MIDHLITIAILTTVFVIFYPWSPVGEKKKKFKG